MPWAGRRPARQVAPAVAVSATRNGGGISRTGGRLRIATLPQPSRWPTLLGRLQASMSGGRGRHVGSSPPSQWRPSICGSVRHLEGGAASTPSIHRRLGSFRLIKCSVSSGSGGLRAHLVAAAVSVAVSSWGMAGHMGGGGGHTMSPPQSWSPLSPIRRRGWCWLARLHPVKGGQRTPSVDRVGGYFFLFPINSSYPDWLQTRGT